MHPDLWETVNTDISTNDKRGLNQTESHIKEKKVRIAYVICVIMFCATGGRCSVPLHTVLTDYIEATGGSCELISVLNKLGAVASIETLERHIVRVSTMRKAGGLLKDMDQSTFTIASTDNIDFLQSHASVYAGSQHRSWHGTSVQVVQPQQRLKIAGTQPAVTGAPLQDTHAPVTTGDVMATSGTSSPPRHQVADRHRLRSSPIDSPSKHGHSPAFKRIKYARSFAEAIRIGEVSESVFQAPEPMNISTTPCSRPRILGNVLYEDFLQSQEEALALSKLKKWIFTYVLHKRTLKPEHLLFSFKEHVAALQGSDIHAEPAVVLYLSIVDMHH